AGELYAFETPDYEIRVYAPDGTFLRRLGRPGTGPGEFSGPARIGVVGDTVWVIESTPPRITLFRSDGTLLSSERYAHVAFPDHSAPLLAEGEIGHRVAGLAAPDRMRADGRFTSRIVTRFPVSTGREDPIEPGPVRLPRLLFDARGAVVDTIGW